MEIVNISSIPDNTKHWQVFEDDMPIKIFLEMSGKFVNTHIDEGGSDPENLLDDEGEGEEAFGMGKLKDSLGEKDIV